MLRTLVVFGVVLVAGLVFGFINYLNSPDSSKVGDCLKVTEFKQGTEPDKADCNDPAANLKIAVKVDGSAGDCPADGNYDKYIVTAKKSYKLCLMINADQGDCLANYGSQTTAYQKVSCTDPSKDAELVKVVVGQADRSLCKGTGANHARSYPQPPLTICIKASQ